MKYAEWNACGDFVQLIDINEQLFEFEWDHILVGLEMETKLLRGETVEVKF